MNAHVGQEYRLQNTYFRTAQLKEMHDVRLGQREGK